MRLIVTEVQLQIYQSSQLSLKLLTTSNEKKAIFVNKLVFVQEGFHILFATDFFFSQVSREETPGSQMRTHHHRVENPPARERFVH